MKSAPGLGASVLLVLSAGPVSGQQPQLHPRLNALVNRDKLAGYPDAISGIAPNRPFIRGGSL